MKTLINIYSNLEFSDIVLYQLKDEQGNYSKPRLVTIIGIDIWDMAAAVYFIDHKCFMQCDSTKPEVKIESFGEWMTYWNILGHWKTMPSFKNLRKAYKNKK